MMNRLFVVTLLTASAVGSISLAADPSDSRPSLDARFENPATADRPWAYWWWLNGNVDKETITRDTERGLGPARRYDLSLVGC